MSTSPIQLSFDAETGLYEACLQREPCNEIGLEMLAALEAMLDTIDLEKGRVLLLHSNQRKGFCAGADLRELQAKMASTPKDQQESGLREFLDRIHSVMDRLDTLPLVTIGLITGVCFGGGFELALTCDILVAEKNARFCFPELRLGIIPGFGGIPRMERELSQAVIRDLIFSGRSLNARKANALGLVSQVLSSGEGLTAARALAQQIARFEAKARRASKAFIKALPRERLEREKDIFVELWRDPAVFEALTRFVESKDIRPYL